MTIGRIDAAFLALLSVQCVVEGFLQPPSFVGGRGVAAISERATRVVREMSFLADPSDYSSSDSDYTSDSSTSSDSYSRPLLDQDDSPSIEEIPVPLSKNSGNRFLALILDRNFVFNADDREELDVMDMHERRIRLTEDHVLYCRKQNLYNDTFNTHDSLADILWSHQLLSSDRKRTIGHAMCLESQSLSNIYNVLSLDPIIQALSHGTSVHDILRQDNRLLLYRWRHIKDHTLRQDDGRTGTPHLLFTLDHHPDDPIRTTEWEAHMKYLIQSKRVIAAGPLHVATETKEDQKSVAVGSLVIFNTNSTVAHDDDDDEEDETDDYYEQDWEQERANAIHFAESDPYAQSGLYRSMRLYPYNSLDVTGKFVSENRVDTSLTKNTAQMKEAMEYWGYPVDDLQTKWLNW